MNKVYVYHLVVWGIRTNKHNNKEYLYFNRCSMSYKSDQISLYKNYNIQKKIIYTKMIKGMNPQITLYKYLLHYTSLVSNMKQDNHIQIKYKSKR